MNSPTGHICLSPPHMSGLEQLYIAEAFASNWIAPLGPQVDAFEQEIAAYVGSRGAAALCSGTAAIHMALKCLGVRRDDEVFCSSFTFAASANPILYEGARPVFIDSDPESWNMSAAALSRALCAASGRGRMPRAVIVVNLYGQCADMDRLTQICASFGVPVIDEAAESLGSTYNGKASGTFGRFGIFSFNGNKIITTSGGGMLVSDDDEALRKVRFWASQSRDPARHYQHSEIGYNYRMSNVIAAIGRGQLRVLEERVQKRRAIFARYQEELSDIDGIAFMPELPQCRSNRWLTTLTVDPERTGVSAEAIMDALAEADIESRPTWKPLHLQPVFKEFEYYPHHADSSACDRLFERGVCLPSGSSLTPEEQTRVVAVIRKCVAGRNTLRACCG